ncbi:MAG: hypothetical protein A3A85_04335 [Deltaproteobacteria bacterium RIFCSPLOWO2_01_FULL_42_9]|nr:MAG: hypothetical protein A3A85_04335 [Deltaproteobacteria bacterium RIFCSPLOWO2_01_FULL_42_9]
MPNARKVAIQAVKAAGKVLMKYFRKNARIYHKGKINLVTSADIAAEKKIIQIIKRNFPNHNFIMEESPHINKRSDFTWVIDPLDGTTSFAHDYNFFCVSIALQHKSEIVLGVVYAPVFNELFVAEKCKGAFLNGKRIHASKTKKLIDCLLATGFPYAGMKILYKNLAQMKKFLGKVQGVRRDGAAALDLCYVACGRFDGFWEYRLQPWDTAAGKLIVEEANGIVTDFKGKEFDIFKGHVVASNPHIYKKFLKILKG